MAWTPQQTAWIKKIASGMKPAAALPAAPKPTAPLGLPAAFRTGMGTLANSANDQYKTGIANVEFQRGQTQAAQGIARGDLMRQFQKLREGMPASYNSRGLLGSGIWKQGLQNWSTDFQRAADVQNVGFQGQLGQVEQQRHAIEQARRMALAQIEAQKQMMIAQLSGKAFG